MTAPQLPDPVPRAARCERSTRPASTTPSRESGRTPVTTAPRPMQSRRIRSSLAGHGGVRGSNARPDGNVPPDSGQAAGSPGRPLPRRVRHRGRQSDTAGSAQPAPAAPSVVRAGRGVVRSLPFLTVGVDSSSRITAKALGAVGPCAGPSVRSGHPTLRPSPPADGVEVVPGRRDGGRGRPGPPRRGHGWRRCRPAIADHDLRVGDLGPVPQDLAVRCLPPSPSRPDARYCRRLQRTSAPGSHGRAAA